MAAKTNIGNVTVGSGDAVNGAVFIAETKTEFPTKETWELDGGFSCIGYTSDEGIAINYDDETEEVVAYESRQPVRELVKKHAESIEFTPIEYTAAAQKLIWGDSSVTGTDDAGFETKHKGGTMPVKHMVIETFPYEDPKIMVRYCAKVQLSSRDSQTLDGTKTDRPKLTWKVLPGEDGSYITEQKVIKEKA